MQKGLSSIPGLVVSILMMYFSNIYQFFLHRLPPQYLSVGFSSIGIFTLYYTMIGILIVGTISCEIGRSIELPEVNTLYSLNREDIFYIALLYLVYVFELWRNKLVTHVTLAVGLFVVLLPLIYRTLSYEVINKIRSKYGCFTPLVAFFLSFCVCFLITIPYIYTLRFIEVVVH